MTHWEGEQRRKVTHRQGVQNYTVVGKEHRKEKTAEREEPGSVIKTQGDWGYVEQIMGKKKKKQHTYRKEQ